MNDGADSTAGDHMPSLVEVARWSTALGVGAWSLLQGILDIGVERENGHIVE